MSDTSISPASDAPHPAGCDCPRCRPQPAPGDVVLAAIAPRHGRRGRAEPTPCLVAGVEEADGERRLRLLPGVPATGRPARRGDVFATAADLKGARSLHGPHLFLAGRAVIVPLGGAEGAGGGAAPVILGSRAAARAPGATPASAPKPSRQSDLSSHGRGFVPRPGRSRRRHPSSPKRPP